MSNAEQKNAEHVAALLTRDNLYFLAEERELDAFLMRGMERAADLKYRGSHIRIYLWNNVDRLMPGRGIKREATHVSKVPKEAADMVLRWLFQGVR